MQLSPKEFEYQFRCLYRPLNMYALRYTENLDDAEDIVQQAFSDVWEKLVGGTFYSKPESLYVPNCT